MMLENYPDILAVKDICEILHIDRKTVYRMIAEKELYARKIGHLIYIPKESLIDMFFPEKEA